MARRVRVPIRLEIVGLDPKLFDICFKSRLAVVESRSKGNSEVTSSVQSTQSSEMQNPALVIYNKVAAISIDFQRAYGSAVEIKVFERSKNRFARYFLRGRAGNIVQNPFPEFFVNGVRVFKGIPNSFSQLDEAIDNSFGRRNN